MHVNRRPVSFIYEHVLWPGPVLGAGSAETHLPHPGSPPPVLSTLDLHTWLP